MKIKVLDIFSAKEYLPKEKSILIRLEFDIKKLDYEYLYQDVLYIDVLDCNNENETNDISKLFTDVHKKEIFDFVDKNIDAEELIIHCHAGLSRSPAVAISILNYLGRREEALKYIHKNRCFPLRRIMEIMNDKLFFNDFIKEIQLRGIIKGYEDILKIDKKEIVGEISLLELLID